MADLVAATVAILKAASIASGRVYGVALPAAEVDGQPRKAVAVRGSGGSQRFGRSWMPTADIRVDVKCYGATPHEAAETESEVASVLQGWTDGDAGEGRVLWFAQSGGPNQLIDPDTYWPYSMAVWQVFGERY